MRLASQSDKLGRLILGEKGERNEKTTITNRTVDYNRYARLTTEEVMAEFKATSAGYTQEQVQQIRTRFGSNEIHYAEKTPLWQILLKAYLTPFTLILLGLAGISFITEYLLAESGDKSLITVLLIIALVLISGTMTLIQSVQANNAAEGLQAMVKVTAAVKRTGCYQEIPMEDIVRGDLVKLSAGDMIPADLRVLQAKDLFISQASLTGESYPIEKSAQAICEVEDNPTSHETLVFMGSNVISGSAEGLVLSTGNDTMFGQVAKEVTAEAPKTSFEIGIAKTSHLLIRFMLFMAPTVVLINGVTKGDWLQALLFGLSVAVGLTPEMLPMIVTTNLVKGSNAMAKEGTIIKNINAIQNFGAIDVLCTDKTGTLTQDKIVLEYHLNLEGHEDQRVLRHAYLNSYYQTGLKNLMDVAIIEAANKEIDTKAIQYEKVDEIPFDFARRRMSVVVEDATGKTQMITKGAIEEMLEISNYVDFKGEVTPLTQAAKEMVLENVQRLNSEGFRVVGVAQKTNPSVVDQFSIRDEANMVLIGYLAFLDPPKETTKAALEALKKHKVEVKVLTGDNALTTQAVCKQVGIEAEKYLSGEEVAKLSENELAVLIEEYSIFVKLNPSQKAMITRLLRENGHVVGFLGDGINDAPAMRAADVGISVDTAVDIAKESADVILLEKDLMVLERGILSGRKIFGNIMKYIKATTSSNFGNMFSVLIASIFLPFLPMMPIHLLLLGIIYDISCLAVPWDKMDSEYLETPKKWTSDSIGKFMLWFGPTSSIFDIISFALLFFVMAPQVLGGNYSSLNQEGQEIFMGLFHAGWFVMSLWTQTMVLYALRSKKLPFIQSNPSLPFFLITMMGIILGTAVPFTALGETIGLLSLPSNYWLGLALTVLAYLTLVTLVKHWYIKKYDELL